MKALGKLFDGMAVARQKSGQTEFQASTSLTGSPRARCSSLTGLLSTSLGLRRQLLHYMLPVVANRESKGGD